MSNLTENLFKNFNLKPSPVSAMGGGQSGGSVVQYTPEQVAKDAGAFSSNAALAAGDMASKAIGTAISVINDQYNRAAKQIQPYTHEGVQALNQLNQYLQLDPYNPGKTPTAPTAPTLDFIKKTITPNEIRQNASQFIETHVDGDGSGYHGTSSYTGPGAHPSKPGVNKEHPDMQVGNFGQIVNDTPVYNANWDELAQQELNNPYSTPNLQYKIDKANYDTDLENWQFATDQYNKYAAEGPFTQQQISDKISNLPGYQAQLEQGIHAIDSDAASKGYLASGKMLKALNRFGQNTLSTFYGNTLSQLASLAGSGQSAASSLSGATQNQGNSLGQQFNNLGTNQANSVLASGNALAQSIIAGGQQFKVMGQSDSGGGGIGSILSGVGSLAGAFL